PQPQPQLQPQPQPQPQPAAARPNRDHLWYYATVKGPKACACCMAPPKTFVPTKWMYLGGRAVTRVEVPYCGRCAWHRMWSGHVAVGLVRFFGLLFAAGGI